MAWVRDVFVIKRVIHSIVAFTAFVDGKKIQAFLMSDDEWEALHKSVKNGTSVIKLRCGNRGFQRISERGTKHFYHERNVTCPCRPETLDHLEIKAMILKICASLGWSVDDEVEGDSWIADITATNESRKIIFEVQLTYQTYKKTVERTQKYVRDKWECVWLCNKIPVCNPSHSIFNKDNTPLSCYTLMIERNGKQIESVFITDLEQQPVDLEYFIRRILNSPLTPNVLNKPSIAHTPTPVTSTTVSSNYRSNASDIKHNTTNEYVPRSENRKKYLWMKWRQTISAEEYRNRYR